MKSLSRHPSVKQDLAEIYWFIARDNPEAALRVLDAIEETLSRIESFPEIGVSYPVRELRLKNIRMLPVAGFRNYLVFYLPMEDETRILYILHGARDLPRLLKEDLRV